MSRKTLTITMVFTLATILLAAFTSISIPGRFHLVVDNVRIGSSKNFLYLTNMGSSNIVIKDYVRHPNTSSFVSATNPPSTKLIIGYRTWAGAKPGFYLGSILFTNPRSLPVSLIIIAVSITP